LPALVDPAFSPGLRQWKRQIGAATPEVSMKASRTGTKGKNAASIGPNDDATQQPSDHVLTRKVGALHGLTAQQLRDEWRRLYRGQPPRLSRDLLIRSLAYRMQELTHGGLSRSTQRKLTSLTREMTLKGTVSVAADVHLKPGTRLMREWHGKTHLIIVLEDGFEFDGKNYPSLTRIAHLITGAHWSGPRFFGLKRKPRSSCDASAETTGFAGREAAAHG